MLNLRGALAVFVSVVATMSTAGYAKADAVRWRHSFHLNHASTYVVNDRAGHVVGAGSGTGLGFWPHDQVATMDLTYYVDFQNSGGPFVAYEVYTFRDGSTVNVKRVGRTTEDPATHIATLRGTFIFVSGSGRFAGIAGRGTFVGKRLRALKAGADQYIDFSGTYKVAGR